jgi:hypothetical protein
MAQCSFDICRSLPIVGDGFIWFPLPTLKWCQSEEKCALLRSSPHLSLSAHRASGIAKSFQSPALFPLARPLVPIPRGSVSKRADRNLQNLPPTRAPVSSFPQSFLAGPDSLKSLLSPIANYNLSVLFTLRLLSLTPCLLLELKSVAYALDAAGNLQPIRFG